jgi:hypothetical protein
LLADFFGTTTELVESTVCFTGAEDASRLTFPNAFGTAARGDVETGASFAFDGVFETYGSWG